MKVRRLLTIVTQFGCPAQADAPAPEDILHYANSMKLISFLVIGLMCFYSAILAPCFGGIMNINRMKPPAEFALLPETVKRMTSQQIVDCIVREDASFGLVQIFPEDYFNDIGDFLHCSEEDSAFMEDLGLRIGRIVRGFHQFDHKIESGRLIYLNLRNPTDDGIRALRQKVDGRVQYAPGVIKPSGQCLFLFMEKINKHEWSPEDPYINRKVCEMKMDDWPKSVRKLWQMSAYGVISNCAFVVNRRHGIPPPVGSYRESVKHMIDFMYRSARLARNLTPLIELSEREATEVVYLTALCRGRVRTMDEFNAAFVPKGETFLVRLTAPECETEIGRMLYDLARKRGLFGRKGRSKFLGELQPRWVNFLKMFPSGLGSSSNTLISDSPFPFQFPLLRIDPA